MNIRLFTVKKAAELLSISPRTLYHFIGTGFISPIVRRGGLVRIPEDTLERWVKDGYVFADGRKKTVRRAQKGPGGLPAPDSGEGVGQ